MKKLSLNLAELRVESFETDADTTTPRGTVRANGDCITYSCQGTCGASPPSTSEPAFPTRLCGDTEDMTGCLPCCV